MVPQSLLRSDRHVAIDDTGRVRLFVAVWPPESVVEMLLGLDRPEGPELRWTTEPQWHVTLRFLGEVETPARWPRRSVPCPTCCAARGRGRGPGVTRAHFGVVPRPPGAAGPGGGPRRAGPRGARGHRALGTTGSTTAASRGTSPWPGRGAGPGPRRPGRRVHRRDLAGAVLRIGVVGARARRFALRRPSPPWHWATRRLPDRLREPASVQVSGHERGHHDAPRKKSPTEQVFVTTLLTFGDHHRGMSHPVRRVGRVSRSGRSDVAGSIKRREASEIWNVTRRSTWR